MQLPLWYLVDYGWPIKQLTEVFLPSISDACFVFDEIPYVPSEESRGAEPYVDGLKIVLSAPVILYCLPQQNSGLCQFSFPTIGLAFCESLSVLGPAEF